MHIDSVPTQARSSVKHFTGHFCQSNKSELGQITLPIYWQTV